ncbi:hypothetical protein, partial [Streptosporangium lutulentum]|uniref:hypothetical protein n=1 Tax=Streptosporangium lutulentum TaxID=1461250 RepID=UPI003631F7C1
MHSEHDRTHGHGLEVRPRGRMPYSESRGVPSPAPAGSPAGPTETLVWPIESRACPADTPVGPRPSGEPSRAEAADETEDAPDPFTRRPWAGIESRPFSMPPPPGRWDRPWSQISRGRLVRPVLIVGFLAAAGTGVWLYGRPSSPDSSAVEAAPAARGPLAGRDSVSEPPSGTTRGTSSPAPRTPASAG